jgi:predicted DNA-binding transcriptional regulator YafY
MRRILIKYRSGDGSLSTRSISDWSPDGEDSIEALCHLRGERRTFKLMSIFSAIDEESGELLTNLWRSFNLDRARDGRERLVAFFGEKVIAIKVLKFYAKSTRGFAKRQRDHILSSPFRKFAHVFFKRPASRAGSAPSDHACARSGH